MEVYVTLDDLTKEERISMPKLIGIDLNWHLDKWLFSRTNDSLTEFIEREVKAFDKVLSKVEYKGQINCGTCNVRKDK